MKELQWVNLRDSDGRQSSLCLNYRGMHPGHFLITGNLEHGAIVRCDTRADAVKLADHVTNGAFLELVGALKGMLSLDTERCMGEVPRHRWQDVCERANSIIAKLEGGD